MGCESACSYFQPDAVAVVLWLSGAEEGTEDGR